VLSTDFLVFRLWWNK